MVESFLYETPEDRPAPVRASVIPVPMEVTVSYGRGTARGPESLLAASREVEYYDPVLGTEPCLEFGIETTAPLAASTPEEWIQVVADTCREVRNRSSLPVLLGGEHTLTLGAVQAGLDRSAGLTVVQIDAHGDLRRELDGRTLSHGTVMRRCHDLGASILSAGVRALSREEADLAESSDRISTLPPPAFHNPAWQSSVARTVKDQRVHITVDLDGLDPSVLPAVGTPVPGGLSWEQTLDLLKLVCREAGEIVSVDVVELAPKEGDLASPFAAALLTYRLIAMALGGKQVAGGRE